MIIRRYANSDFDEWRRLRTLLWPDQTEEDMHAWSLRLDAETIVCDTGDGTLCGFAEIGARPYVDGCHSTPVAYLEGWYVEEGLRGRGIGRALVRAVEEWARSRGYLELASDTELVNTRSQAAHAALGFDEVDRIVQFRKEL